MKHMKRVLTFGMAMALSLSLAVPAFAADGDGDGYDDTTGEYIGGQTITGEPDTDLKEGTQGTYEIDTGKTVPFIGVIKPTQIKATIPTQVVFDLDPTLNVVSDWTEIKSGGKTDINYAQVTNPTNLKILNNSTVPMYVYVSDVKVSGDGFTAANLVNTNTASELNTPKNILFGITSTPAGAVDSIAAADHWIVPKSATDSTVVIDTDKHYVLNPLKGVAPADPTKVSKYQGVAPVSADGTTPGELPLWVNAISITGWNSDDVFTVMPTIIVAAKDPDVTPEYTANTVNPGVNPDVGVNQAQAPIANVPAGDVAVGTTISLTSTGATKIFYTTNGTDAPTYTYNESGSTWTPGSNTTEYSSAISLDGDGTSKTIKAIAATPGKADSAVVTFVFNVKAQVATPAITLTGASAAITCSDGSATIRYTLDGTTPNASSVEYTDAITLNDGQTIKAIAIESGKINSEIASQTYTASP